MRVTVCGSNFGEVYLTAVRLDGSLELGPLLARGSERSKEVAGRYGVPLVTSLAEIDAKPDVACVAVGGAAAAELADQLLDEGVDVLLEHPVHSGRLERLLEHAAQSGRRLHVAVLWSRMPHVVCFVEAFRRLAAMGPAKRLRAAFDPRMGYSLCDTLVGAFDGTPIEVSSSVVRRGDGMHAAMAQASFCRIAGVPLVIDAVYAASRDDDGTDATDGFSIDAQFRGGKLSLLSPRGPVVWSPRLGSDGEPGLDPPLSGDVPVMLGPRPSSRDGYRLARYRVVVDEIRAVTASEPPSHQRGGRLLAVARSWEALVQNQAPPVFQS